jgi:hypothetical protein
MREKFHSWLDTGGSCEPTAAGPTEWTWCNVDVGCEPATTGAELVSECRRCRGCRNGSASFSG